jgi:DNA-binding HxlR family transcriptional regulator
MNIEGDRTSDLGSQLALELVADKWTVLIIHRLKAGAKRYGELQREIPGVSQRMLTHTLRRLERDGLVVRTAYPEVPPRTEYRLTELGETLVPPLHELCLWANRHLEEVLASRERHARRDGGSGPPSGMDGERAKGSPGAKGESAPPGNE